MAIDPSVLGTLPRREFRAGLYEVVKYGMIESAALFDRLVRDLKAIFAREPEALLPVISESCRIKAKVVAADERESGLRRILNFGHTAGHALEAVTKYRRFRHGEAVGYGMLVAADLAVERARSRKPLGPRSRISSRHSGRCRRSPTSLPHRSSRPPRTTRKSSTDACISCCPPPSAPQRS